MNKFEIMLESEKVKLIKCFEGNLNLKTRDIISKEIFEANVMFIERKLGGIK